MFHWLKKHSDLERAATGLYGSVVTQSRIPSFYRDFGVPDTAEGRYEMIVLHMFALIERLRAVPADHHMAEAARRISTELTSAFVTDMDDNFREMGVGDLSVPRKVKKAAGGLYDRTLQYREAVSIAGTSGLADALAENCGVGLGKAEGEALARYVRQALDHLSSQDVELLVAGAVSFPTPLRAADPSGTHDL